MPGAPTGAGGDLLRFASVYFDGVDDFADELRLLLKGDGETPVEPA